MYKFSLLDKIAVLLVVIGALNWGLIGIGNFNLVAAIAKIFGDASLVIERIIYILVGIAALNVSFLIYKSKSKKTY